MPARTTSPRSHHWLHKLGAAILGALLVFSLAACGGGSGKAGGSFVADASAALDAVPNVVSNKTGYTDLGGMGAVINVRVTAADCAQDGGIRPDVLGLPESPTVQEMRDYASSIG